jgi:hypothetical protein
MGVLVHLEEPIIVILMPKGFTMDVHVHTLTLLWHGILCRRYVLREVPYVRNEILDLLHGSVYRDRPFILTHWGHPFCASQRENTHPI